MSIGADATDRPADVAPPTKMPRLEDALRVKKISEHAVLPVRGSDGAAGYDLASAYDYGASPRPNRPDPTSRPASKRDATKSLPPGALADPFVCTDRTLWSRASGEPPSASNARNKTLRSAS